MIFNNFIGGKWLPAGSGKTFDSLNPATGELVGQCTDSRREDLNAAVKAAKNAFEPWRLMPAPRRGEILFRVAERLIKDKEELARAVTCEMGKVLPEGRGDVQEAIDMAYYMAAEGRRQFGQVVPSELPDKSAQCVREPLGVAGLITPWNFPIAIPAWKSMPALVCGNAVVIKPASLTPLSGIMLAEAFDEAGLPPGVFNVVTGGGREVGEPMLRNPKVSVISFTGSTDVGREISIACAPQFKHVHLEMGGKNI